MPQTKRRPSTQARRTSGSTVPVLLIVFVPARDQWFHPIDQAAWREAVLRKLAQLFGGATAFNSAGGVWVAKRHGGELMRDDPVVVHSYTTASALKRHRGKLESFLVDMGTELRQRAVSYVVNNEFVEIQIAQGERGANERQGGEPEEDAARD